MSFYRENARIIAATQDASFASAEGASCLLVEKTMQVSEIIELIERYAPPGIAASWDASGLQVASRRKSAFHLGVVLDPTPDAVAEALKSGADMLLAHHPLVMQPRFLNVLDAYHAVVSLLLTHDVPLYSAHTSLDANLSGPVAWLADDLELSGLSALEPSNLPAPSGPGYGFGFVGDLPEAQRFPDFMDRVASLAGCSGWLRCGPVPSLVRRVACCPGSGGSLAAAAKDAGADIYITGDIKYHAALEAPLGMVDVGHFSLEHTMMQRFADLLRNEAPDIEVSFFHSRNPLHVACPGCGKDSGAA